MRAAPTVLCLLTAVGASVACGDNEKPANGTIGPRGGTVLSDDGNVSLVVPAGAVNRDFVIHITKADIQLPAGSDVEAGTTYQVSGDSVTFAQDAELRMNPTVFTSSLVQQRVALRADGNPGDLLVCTGTPHVCYYVGDTCPTDNPVRYAANAAFTYWSYQGPAVACGQAQQSIPQICDAESDACLASTINSSGQLVAAVGSVNATPTALRAQGPGKGIEAVGVVKDQTPPAVSLAITAHPAGSASTLTLDAVVAEKHTVARVQFVRIDSATSGAPPSSNPQVTVLTELTAEPWTWTSPPSAPESIFGFTYAAIAYDGAGNEGIDVKIAPFPTPQIVTFSVDPTIINGATDVTLTWNVTGADVVTIDQGVGTVAASGTVLKNVSASTTFTLTATNAGGPATAQATVTLGTANDIYVDPVNGVDTNTGHAGSPVKRIGKAVTLVPAGANIVLGDGTYDGPNETCPSGCSIAVPDNVAVRALHPQAAVIDNNILSVVNTSATFVDVVFTGGTQGGITESGASLGRTVVISGCQFQNHAKLVLANSHATLSLGSLGGGAYTSNIAGYTFATVPGASTLTVNGGIFEGNNLGSAAYGAGFITVFNSGGLVMNGVTMRNWQESGIVASITTVNADSGVTLNDSVFDNVGVSGAPEASATIVIGGQAPLLLDNTQIINTKGTGISVRVSSSLSVTLQNGSIISGASGVVGSGVTNESNSAGVDLLIDASSILQMQYGINLYTVGALTIRNNSHVDGNSSHGIVLHPGAGTFPMSVRDSSVKANQQIGIYFAGNPGAGTMSMNLGDSGSSGNNVFQNAGVGLKLDPPGVIDVPAAGNVWNIDQPNTDAAGHIASSTVTGPVTSNINYSIVNTSTIDF